MSIPIAEADRRVATEPVSTSEFRNLMAAFPAGVSVLTAAEPGGPLHGMTCTAIASVSASPPTLLVCAQQAGRTLAVLTRTRAFTVNLLDDQARATAELFAARCPDRFERVAWTMRPGFGGPHLVQDAHTIADCRVTKSVTVADHVVVFGEVVKVSTAGDVLPRPLVYGMREYWSLTPGGAGSRECTTTTTTDDQPHTDTKRPR
ncbi:flavin reductase family protein [Embleya sp. NPDC005971]|uniref:flavin reductase family protein n=1 Tax=unclassified Embleya TaxID=2699296 RepID=UPI0033F0F60B